jgi:hypothetical protein
MTENEEYFLDIRPDEWDHTEKISEEIEQYLDLAENAAIITLNGFGAIQEPVRFNQTKGLILLLPSKAAKNIRFATVGLRLGYYSGSSAVIRSALESLYYAALFDEDRSQVEDWFINEFSTKPFSEKAAVQLRQARAAKKAMLSLENDKLTIEDAMNEFLEKANQTLHTSMRGLAEEFGMDVGELLPDDFETEYEKAGGDFEKAIKRFELLRHWGKNYAKPRGAPKVSEITAIQIYGRYYEKTLDDLAMFCFFVAHRVLDMAKVSFNIKNEQFSKDYRAWHKEVRDEH